MASQIKAQQQQPPLESEFEVMIKCELFSAPRSDKVTKPIPIDS